MAPPPPSPISTTMAEGDNNEGTHLSSSPKVNSSSSSPSPRNKQRCSNSNSSATPRTSSSKKNNTGDFRFKKFCSLLPFENMTVTIYIPTVCVGALIGRKGQTISSMQKQAQQLAGSQSDQVRISIVHHLGNNPESNSFQPSLSPISPASTGSNNNIGGAPSSLAMPTYTELDFSDTAWTPVVIHAHSVACLYIAATILDICMEWVLDRHQIQYIFDLPISCGAMGELNSAHATLIGKRGQTLMKLSADSGCRIMVPPKALHLDIVQLEGPLQECTAALEAIATLLHRGGEEGVPLSPSKAAAAAAASPNANNKSIAKNAQIRSNDNKFQVSFLVLPLPSQTKLRNIARRTETVIRKKRLTKAALEGLEHVTSAVAAKKQKAAEKTAAVDSNDDGDAEGALEATSSTDTAPGSAATTPTASTVPWQLTILGSSSNQVIAARKKLKPFLIKNVDEETNIELRDAMSVEERRQARRNKKQRGGGDIATDDDDASCDEDLESDNEEDDEHDEATATTPKGTRSNRADSTVSFSSAGEEPSPDKAPGSPSAPPSPTTKRGTRGGRGRNRSNSHGKK